MFEDYNHVLVNLSVIFMDGWIHVCKSCFIRRRDVLMFMPRLHTRTQAHTQARAQAARMPVPRHVGKHARTHTHLAGDELQSGLAVGLLQRACEDLVLHVREAHPGEDVLDQRVKAEAVGKRQLGHGVEPQSLHNQTAFLD